MVSQSPFSVPPGNGFTALRFGTNRSRSLKPGNPMQKAESTEKSAELRPPKSAETRSETAVMSSASAGRFAAAFSACAPVFRAGALIGRQLFTVAPTRTARTRTHDGVFYFIRECRPRPERMNARFSALNACFRHSSIKNACPRSLSGGWMSGGVGSRTPVRKSDDRSFSERSPRFKIPSAEPPWTALRHW